MKIFEDLVPEEKQHNKYKCLKNSFGGEREILQDWIQGFEDRDGKIINEFQTTFHSSFWEFYLFAVFKEAGFKIDFTYNSPDFVITAPKHVYVEAVTSNIKQNGRKESDRNLNDHFSMLTPTWEQDNFHQELDESIIRHSNAILEKSKKYKENYKNLPHIKTDVPYIVALGAFEQVNYGNQFYYPMIALLYQYYYNPKTNKYSLQKTVKKATGSEVPLGLFCNEKNNHISAIIFSSTVTLGKLMALSLSQNKSPIKHNFVLSIGYQDKLPHFCVKNITPDNPETISDGLFIFHNPFASNKLSYDFLKETNATHIFMDKNKKLIVQAIDGAILYSRFNSIKIPDNYIQTMIVEEHIHFNHREILFIEGTFNILEIDYDLCEITLCKQINPDCPVIVDLTVQEIIHFKQMNLQVSDCIQAVIFSIPESNNCTEIFKFLTEIQIKRQ